MGFSQCGLGRMDGLPSTTIPPPAVRPSVKHDSQQRSEDDITHIIVNIIKANKTFKKKLPAMQMAVLLMIGYCFTVLYCYTC